MIRVDRTNGTDLSDRTILITGAGGFTGRHACGHFRSLGMRVVAMVRSSESEEELRCTYRSLTFTRCDMTRFDEVLQSLDAVKPEYVLHLAGLNEVRRSWIDPVAYMASNVMSTVHLLDGLRRHGMNRIQVLIAGSALIPPLSEVAPPPHPYSLSKSMQVLTAMNWGRLFKLPVSVVQSTNLIGPGFSNGLCGLLAQKIVRLERKEDDTPFQLSSTHEVRDFLDVRDAVRGYEAILMRGEPGEVYPLGSGVYRSLGDIVRLFESLLNRPIPLEIAERPVASVSRRTDEAMMKRLGWSPSIPIEQSISDILTFYRMNEKPMNSTQRGG